VRTTLACKRSSATDPLTSPLPAQRSRFARRPVVAAVLVAVLAAAAVAAAFGAGVVGPGGDPVLLAAGDIAECDHDGDEQTARLIADYPDATVAALGDLAYQHGTPREFARCFGPSWGRFKDRIRPATGNHDHATEDARGYARFFGLRAGPFGIFRYSYDIGKWHIVVLDSDCWRVGGCELDDPQVEWLRADLRFHKRKCTLAYWHRPPFSSGRYGDDKDTTRVRPMWQVAVEEGVDVVLTGHEHSYERFARMDATGRIDPRGTRLFIVGTGGGNLRRYKTPRLPATQVRNADTWGMLRLTLRSDGYDWRFLPVRGRPFTDSGSTDCT
jgi:acid phosphatase type 7